MISTEDALTIARQAFPSGPEALAQHLKVQIRRSPLKGCDGWCVHGPCQTIIHINLDSAPARQRFTLAHELAHLILGIPSTVSLTLNGMLSSDSTEERMANELASELLLPEAEVEKIITTIPIYPRHLTRLAERANVSEIAVAIRVAGMASQLGLEQAEAIYFIDEEHRGQWPKGRNISIQVALSFLREVKKCKGRTHFLSLDTEHLLFVSGVENPTYNAAALLVQFIAQRDLPNFDYEKRRIELEGKLFSEDHTFRNILQGCLGAFKNAISKGNANVQSVDTAMEQFIQKYSRKFNGDLYLKLQSPEATEYVRIRLGDLIGKSS